MAQQKLDLDVSYRAIVAAARQRKFLTYGDLARHNGAEWSAVFRAIPGHLEELLARCDELGWPLVTALVVKEDDRESGSLSGDALTGFLKPARAMGYEVTDEQAFLRAEQERVFAWAASAADDLHESNLRSASATGPQFTIYMGPILEALRDLGGEADPTSVLDWIRTHVELPNDDLGVSKSGQPRFYNRVAWARLDLVRAGLLWAPKYGIWGLTDTGRETTLTPAEAVRISAQVRATKKQGPAASESGLDEDEPPEQLPTWALDDPDRQFWFAGAVWNKIDQLPRFLKDGVWQDGDEENPSELIGLMKPGDRIAIKAAYVQKFNLPFDAGGKWMSCMRIKATGTLTGVSEDGSTVPVTWDPSSEPREWYFYTYQKKLVRTDRDDELARRLIRFTFDHVPQDLPYFVALYVPKPAASPVQPVEPVPPTEADPNAATPGPKPYTVDSIIEDGCFVPREELDAMIALLREKKNLIVQGAPGTGKTWLAKRLGHVLIGTQGATVTKDQLRVVQFHPAMAYEDFVRGLRPSADGKLEVVDGVFVQWVRAAVKRPGVPFVFVIEEINRGNPAHIFGELLTLIESTKRSASEALDLTHGHDGKGRVYVPEDFYVIGTMNVADRSLAMVDLALRRRFSFVTLVPRFGLEWVDWCQKHGGLGSEATTFIAAKIEALNTTIANEPQLGEHYRVGHSFFTPDRVRPKDTWRAWYRGVVKSEIEPLLAEYWFDAPKRATDATQKMLQGLD